jgi:thioredoxin-like negative regulator of GroEL
MSSPAPSASDWLVVCLCAAWCGVCREWRPLFDAAAAAHAGLRFQWVDVEDEADALGEVDIETFPTLLIARAGEPRFYGPLPPSRAQLERLIASLRADTGPARMAPEAGPLLARLENVLLPKP